MKHVGIKLHVIIAIVVLASGAAVNALPSENVEKQAALVIDEVTGQVFSERGLDVTKDATVVITTSDGRTITGSKIQHGDIWRYSIRDVPEGETRFSIGVAYTGAVEEARILKKDDEGKPLRHTLQESVSAWWTWLLFIPGVLSICYVWGKERKIEKSEADQKPRYGFELAAVNAVVWLGIFTLWLGILGSKGIYKINLFDPGLSFRFYVPILGFIGAMLYILDLYRGREDIPIGKEFGMRLVMGPYVAIVMVVLFGRDFTFLDLNSGIAQAIIAFFSGLLVVIALQGLTERGNEFLGRWREKFRYRPSQISKEFELTKEDDLTLQKVGLRYLDQLRETPDNELRKIAKQAKFNETLALSFKRKLEGTELRKAIGGLVWERLKEKKVKELEEFVQLEDRELEEVAKCEPKLDLAHLKVLRDKAKKFVQSQI